MKLNLNLKRKLFIDLLNFAETTYVLWNDGWEPLMYIKQVW